MSSNEEKYICRDCVEDDYLKRIMNEAECCSYCGVDSDNCIALHDLAELVEQAFSEHYCPTASEPDGLQLIMLKDPECDYDWEREGELVETIIQYEAGVEPEVAEDLRKILDSGRSFDEYFEESEFDDNIQYEKRTQDGGHWHQIWRELQHELKTKTRFFSKRALEVFRAVFNNISSQATKDGRPIFKTLSPGFGLYRARVFQDDELLEKALQAPARLLGPPSMNASGGRMNAFGISVFYGSTSPEVALAEVRPPVGSKVAIAKFVLRREVVVLDLTALKHVEETGSIFDPSFLPRIERAEFLKTFCDKIVAPVMPNFEVSDYLITQATADFLASSEELKLDGIIYPSVQTTGPDAINIVLFHKSAKATSESDTAFSVNLTSCDEGEYYDDYSITPVPSEPSGIRFEYFDDREQTLVLDDEALIVAHVTGVKVTVKNHHVSRLGAWKHIEPAEAT